MSGRGLAGQVWESNITAMIDLNCLSARRMKSTALMVVVATLCGGLGSPGARAGEANWPQFRGPGARGITTNTNVPEHWSAAENVAWKAEIPGRGGSSPLG